MEKLSQHYDFKTLEDKHFFAGLLNTAQNNINLSLGELSRRTGIKKGNDYKGLINETFSDTVSPADYKMRLEYLAESFVFVKQFIRKERSEVRKLLISLIETIDKLRHYYTHFYHKEIKIEDDIYKILDELLLDAALLIRTRVKTEEYRQHLSQKYHNEFDDTFNEAKRESKKADKLKEKDKISFVINQSISRYISKKTTKDGKFILWKYAVSCDEDNKLSKNGFVILMALFLNRKQLEKLFAYTKYFKGTQKLEFQITHWIFSYYAYRDIRKLFRSDFTSDALMLQMLDELSKCPDELYERLSQQKKEEFFEDLNVYYKDNPEYTGSAEDSRVEHEVKRKRYEDKFPYFAIRFLDEFAGFPSLIFSVNLGKFNHNTSQKNLKGVDFNTERSILEKLTVFERLTTATEKKARYFEGVKREEEKTDNDWIEFPMPFYQFAGNNIGIWLQMDNHGNSDAAEKRESGKSTKSDILKKLGMEDSLKKPVAFLSVNEIPALLYALLIEKKQGREIEKIIRNKIFAQDTIIREYNSDSPFSKKSTPLKLKKSIGKTERQINWEKLKNAIIKERDKDPIAEIRKNYVKRDKIKDNEFTNPEKGKIATWLAEDIKRFIAKKDRKGLKGYQYAEFQSLLAFYDTRKQDVKNFIEGELKIELGNAAFDMRDCLRENNLFDFYKDYLKKRRSYLEDILQIVINKHEDKRLFDGFSKRLYTIPAFEQYKQHIKKMPVYLPRGLFDDKPTVHKKEKQTEIADWYRVSNNYENGQKFYQFDKLYEYINKNKETDNQKIVSNRGIKAQYNNDLPTDDQKRIYKNETKLRKIIRQDFYILEMAKHILKEANGIESNEVDYIELKDVFLTKAEKEKIQRDAFDGQIKDDHILSKRIEIKTLDGKVKDSVAIKSIGKFLKITRDERIKQLVRYSDKIWTYSEIADEIESYDKVRYEKIFKSVHLLEEKIFNKAEIANEQEELLHEGSPNFRNYLAYNFINIKEDRAKFKQPKIEDITISEVEKDEWKPFYILAKIRNKFSHNELISVDDFRYLKEFIPMTDHEGVSEYLYRAFNKLAEIGSRQDI
ncbi:MAG: type VI-B CRISPR-associated RNA-guided ribonuclease Cas13b [Bacteroidales bacterium]|nr:type VI-B CRISPR-associated RNA-guided ribonuclease Cas13b [Bacteroidales bacterium]